MLALVKPGPSTRRRKPGLQAHRAPCVCIQGHYQKLHLAFPGISRTSEASTAEEDALYNLKTHKVPLSSVSASELGLDPGASQSEGGLQ